MKLKDDRHGPVFSDTNVKLYYPSHSWNMKALFSNSEDVNIITNGFADMSKFVDQIRNKPGGRIRIICNTSAISHARKLVEDLPDIEIRHKSNINAKIYLRSDGRIFLSSENIGKTNNLGVSIGVASVDAYSRYMMDIFEVQWQQGVSI